MALAVATLVAACGGGGGDSSGVGVGGAGTVASGGIGGTGGTAAGAISSFGSIFLNGVRFDTSNVGVSIDDSPGSVAQLKVGQVVEIKFSNLSGANATANSIAFKRNLLARVDSPADLASGTLTVLGQTVKFDDSTIISGSGVTAATDLRAGDLVEVSGFDDRTSGDIRATRVDKTSTFRNGQTEVEVKGSISGLSGANFTIRGLAVTVGPGATLPPTPLANGQFVEVRGTTINAAGALVATRIKLEDTAVGVANGDRVEIEGLISSFTSPGSFQIGGVTVNASSATFENGAASNLGNGVKAEAEGTVTAGILVATKLSFRLSGGSGVSGGGGEVRLEGSATAVNSTANTITLFGKAISVNNLTQFEDKKGGTSLNLSNFATMIVPTVDHLAVRGLADASGNIVASRVERNDDAGLVAQGTLSNASVASRSFTILGIVVQTGPGTQFKDRAGNTIAESVFYATPAGAKVKAKGVEGTTANSISATEVEIES